MRHLMTTVALTAALAATAAAQNRQIDLEWLRNAGAEFRGVGANDLAGWSVDGAGDVNDDGWDDVVIGAPEDPLSANDGKGNAYIVYGSNTIEGGIELSAAGVVITGAADEDEAGYSVAGAGDVNDDGYDDVIIGADRSDPNGTNSGRAYIIYGGASIPAAINLGAIPMGAGVTINGGAISDLAGFSVDGAGDVNGDGFDDVIIGASGASPGGVNLAGAAYVVYGGASLPAVIELSALDGSDGFVMTGIAASDRAGSAVAGAGDVDKDGFDDVIVGAPQANPNAKPDAGQAYLVYGGNALPASIALGSLGSAGMTINGQTGGHRLGTAVAGGGDVDKDTYADIAVSAPLVDDAPFTDNGRVYLIFGDASLPATLEVSTLGASSVGTVFQGEATQTRLGNALALGDMNRDGFADVIMAEQTGGSAGRVHVFHGRATMPTTLSMGNLDSLGIQLNGVAAGDVAGTSVGFAGDVDGDGSGDVLVGARNADPNGTNSGEAYLLKGGCNCLHASGAIVAGSGFSWRAHGPASGLYLSLASLTRTVDPLASSSGPFWLGLPLIDLWLDNFAANGEDVLPLVVPAPLSGITVHMQVIYEPQGIQCDLTYVLSFTIG